MPWDGLRKFFEDFGWATGQVKQVADGYVEVHWFEDDTEQWIPLTEALAHRVSRDAPENEPVAVSVATRTPVGSVSVGVAAAKT